MIEKFWDSGMKNLKMRIGQKLNSLPNDKIMDRSKLKTFADNKLKATENLKFVLERVENIVGKGENAAWFPAFSPFSINVFKMPLS